MVVAPSISKLTQRIRLRGGNWGVRSLRLALAMSDLDEDGKVTIEEIVAALLRYGLGYVDTAMVAHWLQYDLGLVPLRKHYDPAVVSSVAPDNGGSSLWMTTHQREMVHHRTSRTTPTNPATKPGQDAMPLYNARDEFCLFQLMDSVTLGVEGVEGGLNGAVGAMGALPDRRRQCIGTCFQEVAKRYYYEGGGNGSSGLKGKSQISSLRIPLEYLCRELNFKCHPDVVSGQVNLRDAIWCFYCSWGVGLDEGRGNISETLFEQYWADWCPGYSSDVEFCNLLFALCRIDTTKLKQDPSPLVASKAECDRIFSSIDTNGNNTLSLAELDLAVIRLWPHFNNKPAIMRAYKAADTSGNGWLDREEFHSFIKFISTYGRLFQKFQAVDTDRSGSVTLQELVTAKDLLGLEHETPVSLRAIFNTIDSNRGGKILFEEFCVYMARREGLDPAIANRSTKTNREVVPPPPSNSFRKGPPNFVALNAMGGGAGSVRGGARPGAARSKSTARRM